MSSNVNNKCNFICKHCGERCDRCIGVCESCGCICETEGTYNVCNAHKENNSKMRKKTYVAYDFPTESQVRALRFITMYTGKIFEGKTKEEARIFIREYIDTARENVGKYIWE